MKKSILLLLSGIVLLNGYSMNDPKWEFVSNEKIDWFKLLPSGNVLISDNGGLCGIEPENGSELWRNGGLSGLLEENYEEIPNSSLVILGGNSTVLLNAANGEVIFKASEKGIKKISFREVIPSLGSIMFVGELEKTASLFLLNYKTGEIKWEVDLGKKKSKLSKGLGMAAAVSGVPQKPAYDNELKLAEDGSILFTDRGTCYNIDFKTGKLNWTYGSKAKGKKIYVAPDKTSFILVSGDVTGLSGSFTLEMLDIKSGKVKWGPLEYKGVFDVLMFEEGGALVHGNRTFHKIELSKGKKVFKEYAAYFSRLVYFEKTDKGYLFSKMNDTGDQSTYYVGFDGKPIWKKALSGAILFMEIDGDKLKVIGESSTYMVDMVTGKRIKGSTQRMDPSVNIWADAESESALICISGEKLVRVNKSDLSIKTIFEGVKFLYIDEVPQTLELRNNGYLVTSNENNMMLIDKSGKKVYGTTYRPLGEGFGKSMAMLGTAFAGAVVTGAAMGVGFSKAGTLDEGLANMELASELGAMGMDEVDKNLFERYNFNSQGIDSKLILTRLKDEDSGALGYIGFVNVDKDSGEELSKVELGDREPEYVLDPISNILFYKSEDSKITAYQL